MGLVTAFSIAGGLAGCTTQSSETGLTITDACDVVQATDHGDGTSAVVCLDGTKELVCTKPDCSGIGYWWGLRGTDFTRANLPFLSVLPFGPEKWGTAISGNLSLKSVNLPALTTVANLSIQGNPALASLSFPALTSADLLTVDGNAALATLNAPNFSRVGYDLTITGNPSLPQCRAEAILAQLVGFTGTATISGNDTTVSCTR
ncbi:MAG: hypothetical protein HZB56_18065 [Deltaproteobacteria bacterium]|nr:hypothetical protein [Deltaproteobacteria bacterium]